MVARRRDSAVVLARAGNGRLVVVNLYGDVTWLDGGWDEWETAGPQISAPPPPPLESILEHAQAVIDRGKLVIVWVPAELVFRGDPVPPQVALTELGALAATSSSGWGYDQGIGGRWYVSWNRRPRAFR